LFPKGDPQDPLSKGEIEAKFSENVAAMLGPERSGELLRAIHALPTARDVDALSGLLHA
jgi:hypothetical protein